MEIGNYHIVCCNINAIEYFSCGSTGIHPVPAIIFQLKPDDIEDVRIIINKKDPRHCIFCFSSILIAGECIYKYS